MFRPFMWPSSGRCTTKNTYMMTSLANLNCTYSIWNPYAYVEILVPGIKEDVTTDRPPNYVVILCIGIKNVTRNVREFIMHYFVLFHEEI